MRCWLEKSADSKKIVRCDNNSNIIYQQDAGLTLKTKYIYAELESENFKVVKLKKIILTLPLENKKQWLDLGLNNLKGATDCFEKAQDKIIQYCIDNIRDILENEQDLISNYCQEHSHRRQYLVIDNQAWQDLFTEKSPHESFFSTSSIKNQKYIIYNWPTFKDTKETTDDTLLGFYAFELFSNHRLRFSFASFSKSIPYKHSTFKFLNHKDIKFLSLSYILNRICNYDEILFSKILKFMALRVLIHCHNKATSHIKTYLLKFAEIQFYKNIFLKCPESFKLLDDHKSISFESLNNISNIPAIFESQISSLINLDERKIDFHTFVETLIINKVIPNNEEIHTPEIIATFAPSAYKIISCLKIKDIPQTGGATYPTINLHNITPVFLRNEKRLAKEFNKHTICNADIRFIKIEYEANSFLSFYLGRFTSTVKEDSAREILNILISRRLPFHERRIFNLLHFPGREVFYDLMYREAEKLFRKKVNYIEADHYDKSLLKVIDDILDLRGKLSAIDSQEEVSKLLSNISFKRDGTYPPASALPIIEILNKIISFKNIVNTSPILAETEQLMTDLEKKGSYLISYLLKEIIKYRSSGSKSRTFAQDITVYLWMELQSVFPDDDKWTKNKITIRKSGLNNSDGKNKITAYSSFILACLFHRCAHTYYTHPPVVPYHEARLAIKNISTIHRLSAIFPMCCQDWSCSSNVSQEEKTAKIQESRFFASSYPSHKSQSDFIDPFPELYSGQSKCFGYQCNHAFNGDSKYKLLIWKIAEFFPEQQKKIEDRLRQIGFWLNAIFAIETHSHFRCKCGLLLIPSSQTSRKQLFSCPAGKANQGEHDIDVYLYWCGGAGCTSVIDSRLLSQCNEGWYICGNCNTCGCNLHSQKAGFKENHPACHKCRRQLNWHLPKNNDSTKTYEKNSNFEKVNCICGEINHIHSNFMQKTSEKDIKACLWPRNFQFFKYNTRPVN